MSHEVSMYTKQPRFHRISSNWFLLNASHMFHRYHQKLISPSKNRCSKKTMTFKTKLSITNRNWFLEHDPGGHSQNNNKKQQVSKPLLVGFFQWEPVFLSSPKQKKTQFPDPEAESASDGRITELLGLGWWWMGCFVKAWLVRLVGKVGWLGLKHLRIFVLG